jgi:hypothetical protein
MNNKTRIPPALSIAAALMLAWPSPAVAQPTNADFQQVVTAYQQTPSSETYEKVIKMAAAMEQLPAVPTEARRHFVMGATMFKDAKSQEDFRQASAEFSQAVRLAPWWPDALYNLAQSTGASGDYASAIADLKWYQMFKLSEAEIQAAQEKSWGFEAKQNMAQRDRELAAQKAAEDLRAQQARAAEETPESKKQRELQALLSKIAGRRYTLVKTQAPGFGISTFIIDVKGSIFVTGILSEGRTADPQNNGYSEEERFEIQGRETWHQVPPHPYAPEWDGYEIYVISDDGERITVHGHYRKGIMDKIYFWQK